MLRSQFGDWRATDAAVLEYLCHAEKLGFAPRGSDELHGDRLQAHDMKGRCDYGQADETNRLGEDPEIGSHKKFTAIERHFFLADESRWNWCCRCNEHVDVAKNFAYLFAPPRTEFLRPSIPSGGNKCAGNKSVSGIGIEIRRASSQSIEMEMTAFTRGDGVSGGAGDCDFGELDFAFGCECCGNFSDGCVRLGASASLQVPAERCDAKIAKTDFECP